MKLVALLIIASSEHEDNLKSIAKNAGAQSATIIQARGSNSGEKRSFFSLTFEGNQTLMLYILEEKLSKTILKAINKEIEENQTDCMAFTLGISHIVGLNKEILKKFEESIKLEDNL